MVAVHSSPSDKKPPVVAIDMGYGHLRPAHALANEMGTQVLQMDRDPLASEVDHAYWRRVRQSYEFVSRATQKPLVGAMFRTLLDSVTEIPHLYPKRDLSQPHIGARILRHYMERGVGERLVEYFRGRDLPVLTTFYAPASVADWLGYERVYCVVTDADINRVWAPIEPGRSNVHYFAPSQQVVRRLRTYGVQAKHIHFTGFPLPGELLGGRDLNVLERNLRGRLMRLDPLGQFKDSFGADVAHFLHGAEPAEEPSSPPRLMYAVGGAGAQAELVAEFLPSLRKLILRDQLALTLVAGVRREVAAVFEEEIARQELEGRVEVLVRDSFEDYVNAMNARLAHTDILWTKPSEITFYAALGIPLILSEPVGIHERYNRRWAREHGAGIKQLSAKFAGQWIEDFLMDGTFAAAAWSGYTRLPKFGLYEIVDRVTAHA